MSHCPFQRSRPDASDSELTSRRNHPAVRSLSTPPSFGQTLCSLASLVADLMQGSKQLLESPSQAADVTNQLQRTLAEHVVSSDVLRDMCSKDLRRLVDACPFSSGVVMQNDAISPPQSPIGKGNTNAAVASVFSVLGLSSASSVSPQSSAPMEVRSANRITCSLWSLRLIHQLMQQCSRSIMMRLKSLWLRSRFSTTSISIWIPLIVSLPSCVRALLAKGFDSNHDALLANAMHSITQLAFGCAAVVEEYVSQSRVTASDDVPVPPDRFQATVAMTLLTGILFSVGQLHNTMGAILLEHHDAYQIVKRHFVAATTRMRKLAESVQGKSFGTPPSVHMDAWITTLLRELSVPESERNTGNGVSSTVVPNEEAVASSISNLKSSKRRTLQQAMQLFSELFAPLAACGFTSLPYDEELVAMFSKEHVHERWSLVAAAGSRLTTPPPKSTSRNSSSASSQQSISQSAAELFFQTMPYGRELAIVFVFGATIAAERCGGCPPGQCDVWLYHQLRKCERKLLSCVLLPQELRCALLEPLATHGTTATDFELFSSIFTVVATTECDSVETASAESSSALRTALILFRRCEEGLESVLDADTNSDLTTETFRAKRQTSNLNFSFSGKPPPVTVVMEADDWGDASSGAQHGTSRGDVMEQLLHVGQALVFTLSSIRYVSVEFQDRVLGWFVASLERSIVAMSVITDTSSPQFQKLSLLVDSVAEWMSKCPFHVQVLKRTAAGTARKAALHALVDFASSPTTDSKKMLGRVRLARNLLGFLRSVRPYNTAWCVSQTRRLDTALMNEEASRRALRQTPEQSISTKRGGHHALRCPLGSLPSAAVFQELGKLPPSMLVERLMVAWISCVASCSLPEVAVTSSSQAGRHSVSGLNGTTVDDNAIHGTESAMLRTAPIPVPNTQQSRERQHANAAFVQRIMDVTFVVFEVRRMIVEEQGADSPAAVAIQSFSNLILLTLVDTSVSSHPVGGRAGSSSWTKCPFMTQSSSPHSKFSRSGFHGSSNMHQWTSYVFDSVLARLLRLHAALFTPKRPKTLPRNAVRPSTNSARELAKSLGTSVSLVRNQNVLCDYLAAALDHVHPAVAHFLRASGHHPPSSVCASVLPAALPSRISLRWVLSAFGDAHETEAANVLRDLGHSAVALMRTWVTVGGVPEQRRITFMAEGSPFCAIGIRSKCITEIIMVDMAHPLHSNECLSVTQQMTSVLTDRLCCDDLHHLKLLLGGTVTEEHVLIDGCSVGSLSPPPPPDSPRRSSWPPGGAASKCPYVGQTTIPKTYMDSFSIRNFSRASHRHLSPSIPVENCLSDASPLSVLAAIQLSLEETLWRCRVGLEKPTAAMQCSLSPACALAASIVEPWAISKYVQNSRISFVGMSSRVSSANFAPTGAAHCPMFHNSHNALAWAAPMSRQSSSSSSSIDNSSFTSLASHVSRSSTASISQSNSICGVVEQFPWWDIRDVITARFVTHRLIAILSESPASRSWTTSSSKIRLLVLHRCRIALLALIRRFGSQLFDCCHDDRGVLRSRVPCTVWLPVTEELLDISCQLHHSGDKRGAEMVSDLIEASAMAYPQQVVWPLLFASRGGGFNAQRDGAFSGSTLRHIAQNILSQISRSSKEVYFCVDVAERLHQVFRNIAVLPVEQLETDVRNLIRLFPNRPAPSPSDELSSAAEAESLEQRMNVTQQQFWDATTRHLKQFRERKPLTELERFLRMELLPFTEQLADAMRKCSPQSSFVCLKPGTGTSLSFHEKLGVLGSQIERVLRSLQQVAIASLVPEVQAQQLVSLLRTHGAVLLDMRDAVHMCPQLWGSHRKHVSATILEPIVTTFPSAQRPKRVTLSIVPNSSATESDRCCAGEPQDSSASLRCHFLIKGREDLRQDQRLQRLLRVHAQVSGAQIGSYSVIPLTPSCGIVEWVMHGETVGRLVQQYRGLAGIPMNRERLQFRHPLDLQKFVQYDQLPDDEKLLIYRHLVPPCDQQLSGSNVPLMRSGPDQMCDGVCRPLHCELRGMMLSMAVCGANFLVNRRTFIRSLAHMSILGHVIGLGDRHPSNILIDRRHFQVTHIDFGDAFDRARLRQQLPEHVPFRASRMLERCLDMHGFRSESGQFFSEALVMAQGIANGHHEATHRQLLILELLVPHLPSSDSTADPRILGVAQRLESYSAPQRCDTSCNKLPRIATAMSVAVHEHLNEATHSSLKRRERASRYIQSWWKRVRWSLHNGLSNSPSPTTLLPARGFINKSSVASTGHRTEDIPLSDCGLDGPLEVMAISRPSIRQHAAAQSAWNEEDAIRRASTSVLFDAPPLSTDANNVSLFQSVCPYQRQQSIRAAVLQLIHEATDERNISRHFSGWMPFW